VNIDLEMSRFLKGEAFSSGLRWTIGQARLAVPTRWDVIRRTCAGKNVLHVGFADHLPLIERKHRDGTWLHGQLHSIARRCAGIDINSEAVGFVRERLGIDDVYVADVTIAIPDEVKSASWDVILLGEVLEHLDDPGNFLRALRRSLRLEANAKLLVSVPNATSYLSVQSALHNSECVNSDHRYWFSAYTIAKLLTASAWTPEEVIFCEPSPWWRSPRLLGRPLQTFHRVVLSILPALSETVIVTAQPAMVDGS
jgi:SAM-dependent methyltransferase